MASASSTDQRCRHQLPTFLISKYNIGIKFKLGSDNDRSSGKAEKIPDLLLDIGLGGEGQLLGTPAPLLFSISHQDAWACLTCLS